MVSFWPFRGDDNSAASFEKTLSQLSAKINKATAQNDTFRLRQRKYKVLWTIYAVFTYILIAAILVLVTGWDAWGIVEYTVVAGGPPFIYAVRTALNSYYAYRVSSSQDYLNDLNKQRESVITRLKSATKYDSTQQLLEKYGGSPKSKQQRQPSPQPKGKRKSGLDQSSRQSWPQGGRTGLAPPPTANIQDKPLAHMRQASQGTPPAVLQPPSAEGTQSGSPTQAVAGEEFAPNAFSTPKQPPMPTQPSQYLRAEPKWYDRILDVMLGEDEGSAKNRIALICANCKLVNGQAPPGARTLEDIGRWRCGSCHAWNGVESEEKKILKHITEADARTDSPTIPRGGIPDPSHPLDNSGVDEGPGDMEEYEDLGEEDEDEERSEGAQEELPEPPAGSIRSKIRQRQKV